MKTYSPYPSYKPSGIDWLGDIPQHWEVRKLKHSVSINDDVLPENTDKKFEFEYIDIESVREGKILDRKKMFFEQSPSRARRIVREGDVIVSTVRTYLKAIVQVEKIINPTIVSTGFAVLRASKILSKEFLNYCIRTNHFIEKVVANSTGVGYPAITSTKLSNIEISLPPTEEQLIIARFLDYKLAKIDRFIRKKKQLIHLLNEQKAAIINRLILKGLDNSVKMKNSEVDWIGSIPSHWKVRKTKLLFELVTEVAPPNNTEVLLSIYTQYGVKPRTEFEERGNRATTTDNYWLVKKQDIIVNKLLAWMGAIGISEYDGVTSPAYDILRSKGDANPYYYHYLFRSPVAFTEFKRHSRGIMDVRLRLYFNRFGDIKLPVPPLEEQTAIVAHIEQETAQLNALIQTIEKEIALTQEYRTALIAEAVTGKIDVRGYEVAEMEEEEEEVMEEEMGEDTEDI